MTHSRTLPKISCLTVTYNRLPLLKQAIRCYLSQTYANRELVIVTDGTAFYKDAIRRYIDSLGRNDIRLVRVDESDLTLGAVRNISLQEATGDIICQWDDDDYYGQQRLEVQAQHMHEHRAQACFLLDQLQYFFETRELFWIDWSINPSGGIDSLIPGTLMMYKDDRFRYPEQGDIASAGEDSALLKQLFYEVEIAWLYGQGQLYIYTYHGANTFGELHHRLLSTKRGVDQSFLKERHEQLFAALVQHDLPYPLTVKCGDGGTYLVYNG